MDVSDEFVTAIAGALSDDGQLGELKCRRKNRTVTHLRFPMANAGSFILNIHRAIGALFDEQRRRLKGIDPRIMFPLSAIHVDKIQGALAQGKPIVSFLTNTGIRLDFSLEKTAVRDLIEWLEGLESGTTQPPTPHN